MTWSVTTIDNPQAADAWVLSQPTGSIHQVSYWFDFQEKIPGRTHPLGFVATDASGAIGAVCWGMRMDTGQAGLYWWYSPRGPVGSNTTALLAVCSYVESFLKQNTKALFWRVDPGFSSETMNALRLDKYPTESRSYHPTDCLVMDLSLSEEELLAQMKRKGRYNIKLAQKSGVWVESFSGESVCKSHVQVFMDLQNETTVRDGFAGHNTSYYFDLLKTLPKNAVIFIAYSADGIPIAAAILTIAGPGAIYYFGASTSTPEHRKVMAPYLLQWEMMRHAKAHGCKTYDLTGIAPVDEPEHEYAKMTQFKTRFGGTRKKTAKGKEIPLRGLLYRLYRFSHWARNALRSVI